LCKNADKLNKLECKTAAKVALMTMLAWALVMTLVGFNNIN